MVTWAIKTYRLEIHLLSPVPIKKSAISGVKGSKPLLTCCCAAFFFDLGSLRRVFGLGIMSVYYFVDKLPITRLSGVVVAAANLCGGEMIVPRLRFSDDGAF